MAGIAAKFKGDGTEDYHGIPARDLTEEEFAALTPEQKKTVAGSPLYTMADSTPHRASHAAPAKAD